MSSEAEGGSFGGALRFGGVNIEGKHANAGRARPYMQPVPSRYLPPAHAFAQAAFLGCLALERTHGRPHESCRHILIPPTHSMSHPPAGGCLSHRHRCCLVQTYTQAYTTYFAPLTLMDVRDRGSPLDPLQPCDFTHLTLLHRFLATPVEKQRPSVTCLPARLTHVKYSN